MPTDTAQRYVLTYFRNSIEKGFKRYGSDLTRNIVISKGEEAVFALQDYLANMLASFIVPKRISKQKGKKVRDEYIFDLIQQAKETKFP